MIRKDATAAAAKALRWGYYDDGKDVWVRCPAPCREKVTIDRFTRKTDQQEALRSALAEHMIESH